MKVKVIKNTRSRRDDPDFEPNPSRSEESFLTLTVGNIYRVYGVSYDSFRIMDDFGEPVLYEKELFEVVDPVLPSDWIFFKDGSTSGGPSCYDSEDGSINCAPGCTPQRSSALRSPRSIHRAGWTPNAGSNRQR